jgi:hypothetical protein
MSAELITLVQGGAQTVVVTSGALVNSDPNFQSYVDRTNEVTSNVSAFIDISALTGGQSVVAALEGSADGLLWFPILASQDEGNTFAATLTISATGAQTPLIAFARLRYARLTLTPSATAGASATALLNFDQSLVSYMGLNDHIHGG